MPETFKYKYFNESIVIFHVFWKIEDYFMFYMVGMASFPSGKIAVLANHAFHCGCLNCSSLWLSFMGSRILITPPFFIDNNIHYSLLNILWSLTLYLILIEETLCSTITNKASDSLKPGRGVINSYLVLLLFSTHSYLIQHAIFSKTPHSH